MEFILWLIAVVLVVYGIVRIIRGDVVVGIALIIVGLLVGPGGVSLFSFAPAHADGLGDPTGPVAPDDTLASIRLSAALVAALIGWFIPLIVGVVTRMSSRIKGPLMIVLNIVNGAIVTATMADGTAVFSQQTLVPIAFALFASLAAYYNLWKPNGLTSSAIDVPGDLPGETVSVPGKLATVGVK